MTQRIVGFSESGTRFFNVFMLCLENFDMSWDILLLNPRIKNIPHLPIFFRTRSNCYVSGRRRLPPPHFNNLLHANEFIADYAILLQVV